MLKELNNTNLHHLEEDYLKQDIALLIIDENRIQIRPSLFSSVSQIRESLAHLFPDILDREVVIKYRSEISRDLDLCFV